MERLLNMGMDIFVLDDDHHTPLLVAVQERCIPCVKLALEAAKGISSIFYIVRQWFKLISFENFQSINFLDFVVCLSSLKLLNASS